VGAISLASMNISAGDSKPIDLLLVEDDELFARTLTTTLARHGYRVRVAGTAKAALERARTERPDVVLLDLCLPDADGVMLVGQLRQVCGCPVIVVSGQSETARKVQALDLGADDYVTKPFVADELAARVRSALRRAQPAGPVAGMALPFGLVFHPELRRIEGADGALVQLTGIESQLLGLLSTAGSRPISRHVIHPLLFGREWTVGDRLLDVHVHNLRRKLASASAGRLLVTSVRGVGYALQSRAEGSQALADELEDLDSAD